ncbi:uncharacterized protein LOC143028697 [Oratosquilla oratoria]|uniref:uncharacterized protein LOC143028697 n=1 Tax=Oratosquilla oratoria TaxID=337810 RepID=UPI003F75A87A
MVNRLVFHVSENNLREAQCRFRPNRNTADMIFVMRQVQEKCIEQNMNLYAVLIDLTKAFDTVNRDALWAILSNLGCPDKFINLIKQFHDDKTGQVLSGGEVSEPFNISNGVKQGCVLAPILFNLFFTRVVNHAFRDLDLGVYLRFRFEGSVFDPRRLNAKTKTTEKLILAAHKEPDLQLIVDILLRLPTSLALPSALERQSTISNDGSLEKEISARICKASQALGRLITRVLNQRNVKLSTKLKVYRAVVLTSLLYGCESWTPYSQHLK